MSYARNLLSRGEEIVFETRQHWFAVLAQVWLFAVLAVLALAVLIWQSTSVRWQGTGLLQIVALVVLLGSLARIGLVVWGWQNQEYLVTTRRIIKAEGVLNKAMTDSSLEKINDAHLSQSWLGRIFRYGHLDIMTASDEPGAVEDFPMMADAIQFKISMMNQKELLERPDLARPAAQRPSAPPPMQRAEALPPRAGSDKVSRSSKGRGSCWTERRRRLRRVRARADARAASGRREKRAKAARGLPPSYYRRCGVRRRALCDAAAAKRPQLAGKLQWHAAARTLA